MDLRVFQKYVSGKTVITARDMNDLVEGVAQALRIRGGKGMSTVSAPGGTVISDVRKASFWAKVTDDDPEVEVDGSVRYAWYELSRVADGNFVRAAGGRHSGTLGSSSSTTSSGFGFENPAYEVNDTPVPHGTIVRMYQGVNGYFLFEWGGSGSDFLIRGRLNGFLASNSFASLSVTNWNGSAWVDEGEDVLVYEALGLVQQLPAETVIYATYHAQSDRYLATHKACVVASTSSG